MVMGIIDRLVEELEENELSQWDDLEETENMNSRENDGFTFRNRKGLRPSKTFGRCVNPDDVRLDDNRV
jgi:hypothetical protein